MSDVNVPGPQARVIEGLRNHQLLLQRCRFSGNYVFYPRVAAVGMREHEWDLVPACGEGEVHAATVVDFKGDGGFQVGLVELKEGPRILARILTASAGPLPPGTKVRMKIVPAAWSPDLDHPVPVFEPAN